MLGPVFRVENVSQHASRCGGQKWSLQRPSGAENGPLHCSLRRNSVSSPSGQVKAAAGQVGGRNWELEEKKNLMSYYQGTQKCAGAASAEKASHPLCEPDRTSWKAKEPSGILRCRNTTYSQGISVGIGHTKSLSDVPYTPSAPRT
jgi:hypothetical protein